jgi:phosphoglycolate phosphatase
MRLIVFDVDGTLVDSQADILAAMGAAFAAVGVDAPSREEILGIVGLSLDVAVARLAPQADHARMVEAYKDAYATLRSRTGAAQSSPLYPGARALLDRLLGEPETLLGVATGKSKRGLDKLVEAHGLEHFFVTRQVADFHPSKPHPSMLQQAMAEAGCAAAQTAMIGDTSFDMQMAQAAGVHGIGVTWGYHPRAALREARQIAEDFDGLTGILVPERKVL